jgi:hypothetical protein
MSYILDALKKAAEQRGESVPGFRRLATTLPAPQDRRRAWTHGGIVVACVIAAGATAFVALRSAPVGPVVVATTAPEVTHVPAEAPRTPAVAPPAPRVAAPLAPRAVAPPTPRVVVAPPAPRVAAPPAPPVEAPPAPRVVAPLLSIPPVAEPPRAVPARRPPSVVVAPPSVATPAPMPSAPPLPATTGEAKLKLEVLVYSDVASERMVFINGRKYVQGDTVAERARIEEIQADGVVLSEQGHRFTLRQ